MSTFSLRWDIGLLLLHFPILKLGSGNLLVRGRNSWDRAMLQYYCLWLAHTFAHGQAAGPVPPQRFAKCCKLTLLRAES